MKLLISEQPKAIGFVCSSSSDSSGGAGNTKAPRQISPVKRWIFVWNNYPDNWKEILVPKLSKDLYSIGEEIGDSGNPHLQGYIEFHRRVRALSHINIKEIHWEKAKGNKIENLNYTQKDGKYIQNFEEKYVEEIEKLYDWEIEINQIIEKEPDKRSIYWFWEPNGCAGKTTYQKYIFTHYKNTIVLDGKASDMKNGIINYQEKNNKLPRTILINIPRASLDYVSWAGLEVIKDMFFYSGKYEGGMVCGKCPHVICFANDLPPKGIMSEDRLIIKKITVC